MSAWTRGGYLTVTGVLVGGAATAAGRAGLAPAADLALGAGAAWLLQGVSYWWLAGALERSGRAVRPWASGIALRLGGVAVLAVAGGAPELSRRELLIVYLLTLVALLLLEAVWLARGAARSRAGRGAAPGRGAEEMERSERDSRRPDRG